jgi:hypothetical protein
VVADTWLTWQGIRDLADCEAIAEGEAVSYVTPHRQRTYVLTRRGPQIVRAPVTPGPGSLVYARDVWRRPWRGALASTTPPCVLCTTFNDAHVRPQAAADLLDGTAIRRWFAVQCATTHPKLTAMPIGIDRRDLPALARTPAAERDIDLLVNVQPRNVERRVLLAHFENKPWATVVPWRSTSDGAAPTLSLRDYFAQLARSRFVLSPPGRGWDCYRTYEAIALGAIPIVRREPPLSDVVSGLPVLMVDDWSDVTPAWLARQVVTGSMERMTLPYWAARIREAQRSAIDEIA